MTDGHLSCEGPGKILENPPEKSQKVPEFHFPKSVDTLNTRNVYIFSYTTVVSLCTIRNTIKHIEGCILVLC